MIIYLTIYRVFQRNRTNPHFYKSVENRVFFGAFAHFCPFLTLFYHKISGNSPHFRGGVWEVWKNSGNFAVKKGQKRAKMCKQGQKTPFFHTFIKVFKASLTSDTSYKLPLLLSTKFMTALSLEKPDS